MHPKDKNMFRKIRFPITRINVRHDTEDIIRQENLNERTTKFLPSSFKSGGYCHVGSDLEGGKLMSRKQR